MKRKSRRGEPKVGGPYRHPDHPRPVTRRQFVAQGFVAGTATVIAPTLYGLFASPRAAQALMLAVRARALLDGRLAPSISDVVALAPAALTHRMALSFAARAEGASVRGVIDELMARAPLADAA